MIVFSFSLSFNKLKFIVFPRLQWFIILICFDKKILFICGNLPKILLFCICSKFGSYFLHWWAKKKITVSKPVYCSRRCKTDYSNQMVVVLTTGVNKHLGPKTMLCRCQCIWLVIINLICLIVDRITKKINSRTFFSLQQSSYIHRRICFASWKL